MVDEKKSKFEEYKYPLIVGLGSLVVLIVLISTVGQSLYKGLSDSTKTLKEKRAVRDKLELKLENLKELKAKEEQIKADAEKVTAAMPSHKDISRIFVEFERVAQENGLAIISVSEQNSETATTTQTASVSNVNYAITGSATNYDSLKRSLDSLSKALRILNVSGVDAVNNEGTGLNVSLKITTYLREQK